MKSKLTISIDKTVLDKAKRYALEQNLDLTQKIENFLKSLPHQDPEINFEISPFVRSISTGNTIPNDYDYKKDYRDYLEKKHR
jgi:hypothetical protein